jgi:tripartite ATP-independent transporter DctP family solute receptor
MKHIRSCSGAVLASAVLAISPPAEAEGTTLRIESNIPAMHATSISMEIFKAELARLSEGSIKVEVSAGAPRSLKETIDAVHVGNRFATWTSVGNFSRLVPEIAAVSLPFIFDNYDEARRSIAGPAGRLIATKLEAKGFIVLSWMDLGEFHVVNSKRPLKTLDDFRDLRIRVLPNAAHLATFQSLGARPVAMDFKDADAALRQGDVDGGEMDYSVAYANKYYESQKYISDTRHFLDFQVLIANKSAFASLNPMQQKAVREAATIAAFQERKILAEQEATALARLQELGARFDPLPPATRAALRRATASVVDDVRKWVGAEVVNEVLAANKAPATVNATVSKGSHR